MVCLLTLHRLLLWYSIITIVFRCPSSPADITDDSPKICCTYFQAKDFLQPHLGPYFTTYAQPYVESVKPYYDKLDQHVITPATHFGKKYGAPRIQQAQAYGKAQWEKQLQPTVSKVYDTGYKRYNATLAPHIHKVSDAVHPYVQIAHNSALDTYYTTLLPTYSVVQPYIHNSYELGKNFTLNTGIPYTKIAWTSAIVFLDRTIWPRVKIIYGENVEPQLVRIGERLGRYRDGKKLKQSIHEVDVSASSSSVSSTFSSLSSSMSSAHYQSTTTVSLSETVAAPSKSVSSVSSSISSVSSSIKAEGTQLSETEIREKAQQVVQEDLKTWKEKLSKAATQGAEELEERITEITDRAIQKQAHGVGEAHLVLLEEAVKSELKNLKSAILSVVKLEYEEDDIRKAVRKAGLAIRDKAAAVRTWRQTYDKETNELVAKAAEDTFEIIDHIRDLGLQEIGMRWAWTDGITHKDWASYHRLKNQFDEWRHNVEEVATQHPGLANARAASEDIENRAMEIAEEAAQELARLREVGLWKLQAGDASDDFNTKHMPAAAAAAAQKVVGKAQHAADGAKQAVYGTSSQGVAESVTSVASESIASAASVASEYAASVTANARSVASDASESVESAASSVSGKVAGKSTASARGTAESIISAAQASASSVADRASEAVYGTSQGTVESASSVASASASSLSAKASDSVKAASKSAGSAAQSVSGAAKNAADAAASSASSASDAGKSSASSAASGASSAVSTATQKAKDAAAAGYNSASSAASAATDSVKSVADNAYASGSSAASSASSAANKGASSVSSGASSASSAASISATKGASKATNSVSSASSVASAAANKSASKASSSASSAASKASSIADKKSAAAARSASSSSASVESKAAKSAAKAYMSVGSAEFSTSSPSSIISKAAKTVSDAFSSVSSVVNSASGRAGDEASSASKKDSTASLYTSSTKVWGGAMAQEVKARSIIYDDNPDEIFDDADSFSAQIERMAADAGDLMAHITDAVREAIGQGKPTMTEQGTVESVTSIAAEQYASALSAASVAFYGADTTQAAGESLASVASSRYSEAVAA
jgi:hypothetical protein